MIKKLVFGLTAAFIAGAASAAVTISVDSANNYGGVGDYTDLTCPTGLCQNFTAAMNVTGSVTLDNPPPTSVTGYDISTLATSWTFSNGINTISSGDTTQARVVSLTINTDATGNVTAINGQIQLWLTGSIPHSTAERLSVINLSGTTATALHNAPCTSYSGNPPDICSTPGTDSNRSQATGAGLSFQIRAAGDAVHGVPTMSEWGLIVMATMIGLLGFAYMPRSRRIRQQ